LGLALDEPHDTEEHIVVDGLTVRIDPRAAAWADDSVIDYINSFWGKGLTIRPSRGSC
jgi:Fe-S cluster assembly iron-binding protein IscA